MSNDEQQPGTVSRREFTKNVAKFGLGAAIALYLGIAKVKDANASCLPSTCHYEYQNRSSPSCPTGTSCWTRRVCCAASGSGYVYYAWQRAHCGVC